MIAPDGQITMTDPEGIGLVILVALLFLIIRLLPRIIAGWQATINPLSLKRLLETPDKKNRRVVLLDVRLADEFHGAQGHIPNAINVPLLDLQRHIDRDDYFQDLKQHRIVLICQTGARAALAVRLLRQHGYRGALLLEGGMRAWISEELPLIRSLEHTKESSA